MGYVKNAASVETVLNLGTWSKHLRRFFFCVVLCVSFSVSGGVSSVLLKRYAFGLLLIHKTFSVLPLVVGFSYFPITSGFLFVRLLIRGLMSCVPLGVAAV